MPKGRKRIVKKYNRRQGRSNKIMVAEYDDKGRATGRRLVRQS